MFIFAKEQVLRFLHLHAVGRVGFFFVIITCRNLCFHYSSFDIIYQTIMRLLIKNKIRKKENSQNGDSLWLSNWDKGDLYFLVFVRKI